MHLLKACCSRSRQKQHKCTWKHPAQASGTDTCRSAPVGLQSSSSLGQGRDHRPNWWLLLGVWGCPCWTYGHYEAVLDFLVTYQPKASFSRPPVSSTWGFMQKTGHLQQRRLWSARATYSLKKYSGRAQGSFASLSCDIPSHGLLLNNNVRRKERVSRYKCGLHHNICPRRAS